MAFASVLYPGRCLASQPIHLGSEVGEGQRCKRGRLRPPPQASPGGERQVDGQHHRLCPMALTALCHSAAAVSSICSFDSSSSFPSPRGIPGHLDRPRRSRPDPSLPLHRHYLRRCCRRHRHCRCLCHRRHTFGQTKRGGLCCRPAVPNAPLVGIFKCLLNCGCRSML
jgi:hypothetical protein